MKKILFFAALSVALFSFFACTPADDPGKNENPGNNNEAEVTPEVIIASGNQLSVAYDQTHASFNYELLNGVEDGEFEIEIPDEASEWMKNIKIESFTMSGVVSFDLTQNKSVEPRNVILELKYTYDTTKVVKAIVNVVQDALQYEHDVDINAVECRYHSNIGTPFYEYELRMGQNDYDMITAGAEYYDLIFCCSNKTENLLPEPGRYLVVSAENEDDHTIKTDGWSAYSKVNAAGDSYEKVHLIEEGWINVSEENGVYTIEGFIKDDMHEWHKIYYQGEIDVRNMTIASSLTDNVESDINEMVVDAYYNGNAFGTGSVWMLVMYKEPKAVGDLTYQVQLIAPVSADMSTKLPDITFLPDETGLYDPYTFTKGTDNVISYNGSWVFSFTKYDEKTEMFYVGDPAGPFIDGVVELQRNDDDTYNINIAVQDDANHTINASGENVTINFYDNTK